MAKHQRDPAKEAHWRKILQRFSASGLTVREFCRRERLAEHIEVAVAVVLGVLQAGA